MKLPLGFKGLNIPIDTSTALLSTVAVVLTIKRDSRI
jgi:hypothetical protein